MLTDPRVCLEEEQDPVPTILEFIALVALTAFLAAWAHGAQRRHGSAVALYLVFGAISLGAIAFGLWSLFHGDRRGYLYLATGIGIGLPLLGPLRHTRSVSEAR